MQSGFDAAAHSAPYKQPEKPLRATSESKICITQLFQAAVARYWCAVHLTMLMMLIYMYIKQKM